MSKDVILPPEMARDRLVDSDQAAAFTGYSTAHWRRLYQTGKAPKPIKINGRKNGWKVSTLIDLVNARETSNTGKAA